ncbi:peptidoglycan hydrolase RipC [Mycobacterium talmoniae]|uniref:Endopeptidase n=1 Tax=Mycobacterium talmoniae TaxID=1858794 RepID=A0A1S1MPI1_9MYCO|nr:MULTISPECIES: peptidoglycan hydrolase RipC [Mycobacterium]OHU86393.1 endopeptidase [Mycobacterium talmoniae]TDH48939.1 endopeptidase [Mycobacterium eburneum]
MKLDRTHWTLRVIKRPAVGAISGFVVLSGILATHVQADPADDALAKLNELSRQAEKTTEAMHSAQLDLNEKLAAQGAAEKAHADDEAKLQAAKSQLANFQTAVDKFAAATYMGGRTDGMDAILTAESPQQLIDKLAVQRVVGADMSAQVARYRAAGQQAAEAEQASAKSAAEAKTAAEHAATVRADLQSKQSRLQMQIAVVKSQYSALTPGQRATLAAPGPAPEALPAPAPEAAPPTEGAPEAGPPGDGFPSMAPGGSGEGAIAVQAALTQVGSPYVWGGAAPGGFDCSGLVMWAFRQAGISLPHSSQAQANGGQPVALSDLQPGDVLTFYSDASHSGIYVGDGMMIHSSTYGQPVRVVPMYSSGPIHNARRY